MKIACIAPSRVPATTANSLQVMKACQALTQNGHSVRLYLPDLPEERPADAGVRSWERLAAQYGLSAAFEIEWLPTRRGWRRYDLAWKAVGKAQTDGAELIYTWLPQAAWLALARHLPAVLEIHDRISGRLGPFVFRRFLAHPGQKRVLTITHALQRRLETDFGYTFAVDEIAITPNGVDLERFNRLPAPQEARSLLGLPERGTAVYTGHLYAGRGMQLLAALAARCPQVSFVWVGGRPQDVAEWKKHIQLMGLTNVTLTGFIDNARVPTYQAAADLLLMPYETVIAGSSGGNSAEICSPMKMFEYMAAGRAIVTSDLPVIREVLDENTATFCPADDVDAWQKAISGLLADPARREQMAQRARLEVDHFTWQAREKKALAGFSASETG
jgi:glycosyltransferase involved in cell wall biosynthesis